VNLCQAIGSDFFQLCILQSPSGGCFAIMGYPRYEEWKQGQTRELQEKGVRILEGTSWFLSLLLQFPIRVIPSPEV